MGINITKTIGCYISGRCSEYKISKILEKFRKRLTPKWVIHIYTQIGKDNYYSQAFKAKCVLLCRGVELLIFRSSLGNDSNDMI